MATELATVLDSFFDLPSRELGTSLQRERSRHATRRHGTIGDNFKEVQTFWSITLQSLAKEKFEVTRPGHQDTVWPSKAKLRKLVWKRPMNHVAKELGVSGVALKKHGVKLDLKLPPMGYWIRQRG